MVIENTCFLLNFVNILHNQYVLSLQEVKFIQCCAWDNAVNYFFLIFSKAGCIETFNDLIIYALKDENFKQLSVLYDICGTFQASSADYERGFSLMNAIKSKTRNKLNIEHLDNLMRIKSYILQEKKIDLDGVHI